MRASASPSTGAYLDSASVVKWDPANISFQWPFPHSGPWLVGQEQCFWCKRNPMPALLQSLDMQVGLSTSKLLTPSMMSCTIFCLDSWKMASWVASQ